MLNYYAVRPTPCTNKIGVNLLAQKLCAKCWWNWPLNYFFTSLRLTGNSFGWEKTSQDPRHGGTTLSSQYYFPNVGRGRRNSSISSMSGIYFQVSVINDFTPLIENVQGTLVISGLPICDSDYLQTRKLQITRKQLQFLPNWGLNWWFWYSRSATLSWT